jgi:hypothetical protein
MTACLKYFGGVSAQDRHFRQYQANIETPDVLTMRLSFTSDSGPQSKHLGGFTFPPTERLCQGEHGAQAHRAGVVAGRLE